MTTRRILKTATMVLSSFVVTFYSCDAARIYNNMSFPIRVIGTGLGGTVAPAASISPEQRSESLNWDRVTAVDVARSWPHPARPRG